MGSKLSTGAFGTSKHLRTTCKCSAMMLILSSLPKIGNAASASGDRVPPALPSLEEAFSKSSLSFDTQWSNKKPMTPLEKRVNRHINDILEEVAAPKAASPERSKPARKSARPSAADAPSRSSPSKRDARKNPPIPTATSSDDDGDLQSPTVEDNMELSRQNSVPNGDRTPPAFERIETAESPDAGPRQIDYSRFSFFREWMKEFEREQEENSEIEDPVLKKKIEAAMKKEEWDTVGPGTKAQEAGTFDFPDYEDAIRRLLEFTRRKKEQALRKAAKAKRARKKPSKKKKSAGGFSFSFDDNTDWTSGAFGR